MSDSSIMSVRDMIDSAFGEADVNIVNFKLIQAVLYLLARQLRILERKVKVAIKLERGPSKTSLSVTELKIHATVPRRKKQLVKPTTSRGAHDKLSMKSIKSKHLSLKKPESEESFGTTSSTEKFTLDKSSITKSSSDKTSSDKKSSTATSTDKTSSSKNMSVPQESADKTANDDRTTSSSKKSSSIKDSSDNTMSGDKATSSKKSYSLNESSDKTTIVDKTSTLSENLSSTKEPSDKTISDDKITTSGKMSSSTKESSDKTTSGDKTTTSSKLSSSTKESLDKTTSDDKTTSSKKLSSTKDTSDKTTSGDKTTTSSKLSSSTKDSSEKTTSGDKTTSSKKFSSTKDSSDKTTSDDKTTTSSKMSSSIKYSSHKTQSDKYKRKDLQNLLDEIEEQREKELRIIHQRADSHDAAEKLLTPMASLDSIEEQYEKLLIVERIPADAARSADGKGTPQLSIVTQEQFEALANIVRDLQGRFDPIATPDFPDNIQMMQDLRKGASLTDAMAALQLSARLEAAEKTLKQMMDLVTDLTVQSGVDIEMASKAGPDINITKSSKQSASRTSKKFTASKTAKYASKSTSVQALPIEPIHVPTPPSESSKINTIPKPVPGTEDEKLVVRMDWITYDELDNALQEVIDELLKTMNGVTSRSNANAENAVKIAKRLEEKLDYSLNLGGRMNDLELLVSEYSEQINILDTGLSSQMTNYQEQLTQMQHDLEAGLESMAEALVNTGGDTVAVAELNSHFTNLQIDVDNSNSRQKELMESQNLLSRDLQALWQQIELLRELKSDRDEVVDALRDKAGLGALNGLVSLQQFHAVRGDFEKRIGVAYDKFNNQELTWQKAIDDLQRELNDKADWVQLVALRDDVTKIFDKLRRRTEAMLEIVGEPRAAAVTKKLFRDAACLSCSTPAHMQLEETNTVPKLPAAPLPSTRPPTIGAEDSSKPAEDGDHGICYPGLPIPHPRDPRSHVCQRWCGGSHTVVADKKSRVPVGMIITPALRGVTTAIGSDGKTYIVEEAEAILKPCLPCNEIKLNTPQPSVVEPVPAKEDFDSDMTTLDFRFCSVTESNNAISVTPPPPLEDF